MKPRYEVVTFDCYGTLVDWESGIFESFRRVASKVGASVERRALLEAYAEAEPAVQRSAYRPYRDVLREAAARVATSLGWAIGDEDRGFLADGLPAWPVFPDTVAALETIRTKGVRVGILSNIDRDLLAGTVDRLGFAPDFAVTAEDVASYKPHHGHFREASRRIGDASWMHAAQSVFHDVVPARELGIPVTWINRQNDPAPPEASAPDECFRDLAGFAAWL